MIEKLESNEQVIKVLKEEVSKISGINLVEIDENLAWEDYFFDSIKLASLANILCNKLNIEIELIELYNSGSIKNASMYLFDVLKKSA